MFQNLLKSNYNRSWFYFLIPIVFFILFSCSQNEDQLEIITSDTSEIEIIDNSIPAETLTLDERLFIKNLLKVENTMPEIWEGYNNLRNSFIFIVTEEDKGILINPPSDLPDVIHASIPIENNFNGFESLNLYRNKKLLEFAKEATPGIRFYDITQYLKKNIFIYDIAGNLNQNFYYDYKNQNGYFYEGVFFHELFHFYTVIENREDFFGDNFNQDFQGFPLNEDTLPLQLLLFEVMKDAYQLENKAQQLQYLSYYVSIQNKLLELDTTEENFVRSHGLYEEKVEGSARFVEVYSTLNGLNNDLSNDPTHGYEKFASTITTKNQVQDVYGFRIFYHTGAGAITLLKQLDYPNFEDAMFIPTNTPYDLAFSYLNLSQIEMENALNEVKDLYNWDALIKRSEYLLSLP